MIFYSFNVIDSNKHIVKTYVYNRTQSKSFNEAYTLYFSWPNFSCLRYTDYSLHIMHLSKYWSLKFCKMFSIIRFLYSSRKALIISTQFHIHRYSEGHSDRKSPLLGSLPRFIDFWVIVAPHGAVHYPSPLKLSECKSDFLWEISVKMILF